VGRDSGDNTHHNRGMVRAKFCGVKGMGVKSVNNCKEDK
jgi:hypothetical protein